MKLNCKECAGCCIDWRSMASKNIDMNHEWRGKYKPIDNTYNLVVLTKDDIVNLLQSGYVDSMTPRLFYSSKKSIEINGISIASIDEKPIFFIGIRKVKKPVSPFGKDSRWLPSCIFLDPSNLQCRIHDSEIYPESCFNYPKNNIALDLETECERVEKNFNQRRLKNEEGIKETSNVFFGPEVIGHKIFVYQNKNELSNIINDIKKNNLDKKQRYKFIATAIASSPGSTTINKKKFQEALSKAYESESWINDTINDWKQRKQNEKPNPKKSGIVETKRGAPKTPGWD